MPLRAETSQASMSPPSGAVSVRSEWPLFLALACYGALSLLSMATMSIGVGLVLCALFWSCGGLRGFGSWARQEWGVAPQAVRRFAKASLLFWGAGIFSLVMAVVQPVIIAGVPHSVHPLTDAAKSWYFAWPFLLALGLRRLSGPERAGVLRVWLLTCLGVSLVGIVQFFSGWPRPQPIPTFPGKFHATMFIGHHLSVVSIWIFPFFVALEAWFAPRAARTEVPWLSKSLLAGITLSAFLVLVLAFSRTGWAALVAGTLVWAILRIPRERWKLRASAVISILLACVALWQWEPVQVRLRNTMGVSEREQLWREAWNFFLARPLSGVGWQNTLDAVRVLRDGKGFIGHAHSMPLELLSSMGAPGLIAYLFWWIAALGLFRAVDQSQLATSHEALSRMGLTFRSFLAACIAFFVNSLTQVNYWDGKVLHQVMWMIGLGLAWSVLSEQPSEGRS